MCGTVPREQPKAATELGLDQTVLKRMFVFDLLVNNADRKSSHLFVGRQDRRLWGIDHGLTFHVDAKLRTVIWNFCGEPLDSKLRQSLDRLIRHQSRIGALLDPYLRDPEIDRIFLRADQLRRDRQQQGGDASERRH